MTPQYQTHVDDITAEMLYGFFVGWPNPPAPDVHLQMLRQSAHVVIAREATQVIGFVNAISDGVLSAYIPLLEVLPSYQHQGIGSELMRRMLNQLRHLYAIDLMCDAELQKYYERFGMVAGQGMMFRNYDRQNGSPLVNEG